MLRDYGAPSLETAAEVTGMSPRSIQRRLTRDGLNYRCVIDRVRFPVATEMLTTSHASLDEIVFALGYSRANNFMRAFRSLTGVTPGEYRRRHLCAEPRST
jgi:AraC-like DNA-binding protein